MTNNNKTRIVVGLSGGVDSSAAASLLVDQGYDVVGITLKVWPQDCVSRAEDKCCGPQAVMDARSVADKLDIPYYLVDESKEFQRDVIDYFAAEYKAGRTPNPCVMCNEKLKFGNLIDRARKLGAEYVATGHYARLEQRDEAGRPREQHIAELRKSVLPCIFVGFVLDSPLARLDPGALGEEDDPERHAEGVNRAQRRVASTNTHPISTGAY